MKGILFYLAMSASATLGLVIGALLRGGDVMDDYGPPCKWLSGDDEVCVNADCPVCAEWCPCGYFAAQICKYYERGDDDADR